MYNWRQMTLAQRQELLALRRQLQLPWHSPPHREGDTEHYHLTAACYEHRPIIGTTPERMAGFAQELLALLTGLGCEVRAWCVLPNHYHLLLKTGAKVAQVSSPPEGGTPNELSVRCTGFSRSGEGTPPKGGTTNGFPVGCTGFSRSSPDPGSPGEAIVPRASVFGVISELGRLHGRTSHRWNGEEQKRGRQVWCKAVDRGMRSEAHYWATMNYVHHNPVKHGYVARWQDWPYSSAIEYLAAVGKARAEEIWRDYPILDYGKGWDDL